MKKSVIVLIVLIFSLFLGGCIVKKTAMDQLSKDNNYHYQNKLLKFSIVLPPEFKYYQTQRKEEGKMVDLEFFVPTSDRNYPQEVPGYAKPIIIRVLDSKVWQDMKENTPKETEDLIELGEKGKKIYLVRFWQLTPADWQSKWSEDMRQGILDNFKVE